MLAKHISHLRTAGLLAGGTLALSGLSFGADKTSSEADAFPIFDNNYIQLSAQAVKPTGDKTAFQTHTQNEKTGFFGVEAVRYGTELSKDTNLQFDGRILANSDDYMGKLSLVKSEVASVEAGYKRFRTYYDGVGGFFPVNSSWLPLMDQDLHVDRAMFWADAKVELPNMPVFEIRYTNELRNGRKDTTIWGGTDITGLPNVVLGTNNAGKTGLLTITPTRKSVAGFTQLGERHQNLEGSVTHTVGNTTLLLKVFNERINNLDTRIVYNSPGEVKPFVALPTASVIPGNIFNNQIIYTQIDGIKTDMVGGSATAVTVFSPSLTLRMGVNYQNLSGDFMGSRPVVTTTPTSTTPVAVTTNTQDQLVGTTASQVFTGNISLDWKATNDFNVKVSWRDEELYTHGIGTYNTISASGNPATTLSSTPVTERSAINDKVSTPVLDLRYTGISSLTLYASGSQRSTSGDERLLNGVTAANTLTGTFGKANNSTSEDHGNYTFGANWRQSSYLTLRGELFKKDHENKAVGYGINLGDNYILDSQFTGVKLTAIVKPFPTVTSTTRYVAQRGKMQVTGYLPGYEKYDSMDAKNDTISETLDWTPCSKFYAQGNINVVYNTISTVYPRAGITPATASAASYDTNNVLQNSLNDNITGSILLGFVVSKDDDVQVQGNYYRASNGNAALAPWTMPYGVAIKEQSITVGLKHKFSKTMIGEVKVGQFDCHNDTTGGLTNFKGTLGYVSLTQAF